MVESTLAAQAELLEREVKEIYLEPFSESGEMDAVCISTLERLSKTGNVFKNGCTPEQERSVELSSTDKIPLLAQMDDLSYEALLQQMVADFDF